MRQLLLLLLIAAPAGGQLRDAITFTTNDQEERRFGEGTEVERYSTIQITVDQDRLLTAEQPKLLDEILFYREAAATLVRAEAERLAILSTAVQAGGVTPAITTRLAQVALALTPILENLRDRSANDPDFSQAVDDAILGDGYEPLADLLAQRLRELARALQRKTEGRYRLAIIAELQPPDAPSRVLHLPPYVIAPTRTGPATPNYFPVVDDRTRREAAAAGQAREIVTAVRDIGPETQQAITGLRAQFATLRNQLQTTTLNERLAALIAGIDASANDSLAPLRADAQRVRTTLDRLSSPGLTLLGEDDVVRLFSVAAQLDDTLVTIEGALRDLPAQLDALRTSLAATLQIHAELATTETVQLLQHSATQARALLPPYTRVFAAARSFASGLRGTAHVGVSAAQLAAAGQDVTGDADLNAVLDLRIQEGDLHVGDPIKLTAVLTERNPHGEERERERITQSLVVMRYGLFPDSVRGALLLVQPRSTISRDISYQPVPALGYFWHYGRRGYPVLARSVGVGFSVALLDFTDENNIELGIAGTATLLEMFWVGYGRNLQARASYFSVGLNPHLIARLFSQHLPRDALTR